MYTNRNFFLPLIFLFIILNIIFFSGKSLFEKWMIDRYVLIGTNIIFFVISLLIFTMQRKSVRNKNPHVFVRSVLSGVMIKMFACIAALLTYYFTSGNSFNKPAVYGSMVIYVLYLITEVLVMMKLNKQKHV